MNDQISIKKYRAQLAAEADEAKKAADRATREAHEATTKLAKFNELFPEDTVRTIKTDETKSAKAPKPLTKKAPEAKPAPKPAKSKSAPKGAKSAPKGRDGKPSLRQTLNEMVTNEPISVREILKRLEAEDLAPESRNLKTYVYHLLSKSPEFEHAGKRGYYRKVGDKKVELSGTVKPVKPQPSKDDQLLDALNGEIEQAE